MMTLAKYLDGAGAKRLTDLADELGVSKARLSQLRDAEEWPPALALKIEQATDGALSASDLSRVVADARRTAA